jgi:hypothetical protein
MKEICWRQQLAAIEHKVFKFDPRGLLHARGAIRGRASPPPICSCLALTRRQTGQSLEETWAGVTCASLFRRRYSSR